MNVWLTVLGHENAFVLILVSHLTNKFSTWKWVSLGCLTQKKISKVVRFHFLSLFFHELSHFESNKQEQLRTCDELQWTNLTDRRTHCQKWLHLWGLNRLLWRISKVVSPSFDDLLKVSWPYNIIRSKYEVIEKIDISVIFGLKMTKSGMPDTQKNSKVVKFHFLLLFFANWAILSQKMKKKSIFRPKND